VRASSGAVIHRLDADMLLFPEHIEALARWHHLVPYAVTLGMKRFAGVRPGDAGWPAVGQVARDVPGLFTEDDTEPHDYIEDILRRTRDLRTADQTAFLAHVGATAAVSRELYDAAGGYDPALHLGEDTEFGYRLAQAGGLFIADREARSWHLGPTAMTKRGAGLRRYNRPFLADRMPEPRWLRKNGGTSWSVPLVTAVVEVGDHRLETIRACVDGLLHSDERDLRIILAGSWTALTGQRRDVLDDPHQDLRLIHETYRGEPRVRFVTEPPHTAFPSPFLLSVPAYARLSRDTVPMLLAEAERHQAGLVRAAFAGGDLELWRTAAISRADWHGADTHDGVRQAYGERALASIGAGVADLRDLPADVLADLSGDADPGTSPQRWTPVTVEVGGVRTLLRAAAVVARLSATRMGKRLASLRKGRRYG
jgi:hypothetical protein